MGHLWGVVSPSGQKWPTGHAPPQVLSVAFVTLPTKPGAHKYGQPLKDGTVTLPVGDIHCPS